MTLWGQFQSHVSERKCGHFTCHAPSWSRCLVELIYNDHFLKTFQVTSLPILILFNSSRISELSIFWNLSLVRKLYPSVLQKVQSPLKGRPRMDLYMYLLRNCLFIIFKRGRIKGRRKMAAAYKTRHTVEVCTAL